MEYVAEGLRNCQLVETRGEGRGGFSQIDERHPEQLVRVELSISAPSREQVLNSQCSGML